jgi:hypothetical protein
MTATFGYCTNVHAGADLAQTRANLERYAVAVRQRFNPAGKVGIGLWLSASSARQLLAEERVREWADWLGEAGLEPFTLNGFPYGDFHQRVVKHRVYHPTWAEPARLQYTLDLVRILDGLLAPGLNGSISTLPIAWGNPRPEPATLNEAADNLARCAQELARLERETGRFICLCLEPEPGCVLQRSEEMVWFFEQYLLPGRDEKDLRRYLQVCHDVCHAAVMFEEQADVLQRYHKAGIGVGKVQVSSAVGVPLDRLPPSERGAALRQLAEFNEDRYLHQTCVRTGPDSEPLFYEDLSLALAAAREPLAGEWRVHFHVPVYLQRFGRLEALQRPILECLELTRALGNPQVFEVETYAWGVLPAELQQPELSAGIAQELSWFQEQLPK